MTREEANARIAELMVEIETRLTEAKQLSKAHELTFTIPNSTLQYDRYWDDYEDTSRGSNWDSSDC